MAKKTPNIDNKSQSVWQENGIPPLEYCSIVRASELLKCQTGDIYHWINTGKVYPVIQIETALNVRVYVTMEDSSQSPDDVISMVYGLVSKPSRLVIHECVRCDQSNTCESNNLEIQQLLALLPPQKYRFELVGNIAGIWSPSLYESWHDGKIQVLETQNMIFPVEFDPKPGDIVFFHSSESIEIQSTNLMIMRADIEKIYRAGLSGEELGDSPVRAPAAGIDTRDNPVNVGKVGDLLDMLIRCVPDLGDRVMSASANARHEILCTFLTQKKQEGKFVDMQMPTSASIEKYIKI